MDRSASIIDDSSSDRAPTESPASPAERLRLRSVTVRRGRRSVVTDVSLAVRAGEIVALVGPNGSGKTTLLRAAVGLVRCEGAVFLGADPLERLSPRQRARRVAYVPQQSGLNAALLVEEVVAQGRLPHRGSLGGTSARDRDAIRRALDQTDTAAFAGRSFCQLSHGERRRVLIARALATEAPLLVLDEPTAALDVRHVLELFELLRRLRREGLGIWLVLHQLQEVTEIADRAMLLSEGRVVCEGPVDRVIAPDPVRDVYGVELIRSEGLRCSPAAR